MCGSDDEITLPTAQIPRHPSAAMLDHKWIEFSTQELKVWNPHTRNEYREIIIFI